MESERGPGRPAGEANKCHGYTVKSLHWGVGQNVRSRKIVRKLTYKMSPTLLATKYTAHTVIPN